jgi:hypothetical protein
MLHDFCMVKHYCTIALSALLVSVALGRRVMSVCREQVFVSPDDGRLRPKHVVSL